MRALATSEQPGERAGDRLAPVDRMTLAFIIVLVALAVLRLSQPWLVVLPLAALAAAVAGIARWTPRSALGRVVQAFFPIASVIAIFSLIGLLIPAVNPSRWDVTVAALDRRLFGGLPAAWLGALGRPWWLVDTASIAYVAYYFLPVAMAVALYRQGRRSDFDDLVFTVVATFFVSYAGYFLMPTAGPRVPLEAEEAVLGGGAISAGVRAFLRVAEYNLLDAFPSGHATVSLVCLALGWRLLPRWQAALVLLVAGILFSTVYLSLHYVVDLVAGALLAALMPALLPGLRRLFAVPEPQAKARPG